MRRVTEFPVYQNVLWTTLTFLALTPFFTLGLLLLKGLPSFASGHMIDVVLWIYQVTWMPALLSGLLLSFVWIGTRSWLHFFIQPYDVGRCYSLGAIIGALTEALSTWGYRTLSHRPFSAFWIAGATMAGSLAGACITLALFGWMSRNLRRRSLE